MHIVMSPCIMNITITIIIIIIIISPQFHYFEIIYHNHQHNLLHILYGTKQWCDPELNN